MIADPPADRIGARSSDGVASPVLRRYDPGGPSGGDRAEGGIRLKGCDVMLAQASPPELDILAIAGWIVALIAAAVLLAVAIVAVKRWMFRDQEEAAATPWTLHDLLTLRDSGELTIQQYERLRADVIRTLKEPGPAEKETGRDAAADGPRTAPEGDSLA